MNLDELRAVQSTERESADLQHLRASFYADAAEYIRELERERDRAAARADDPFADPEVRRLTDEIETAREVVEAIYERRLGKLVKRASLAAADLPVDEDALTAEERELFEDLVDRIEANKGRVLDVLETDEPDREAFAAEEAAAVTAPEGSPASGSDPAATPVDGDETGAPGRAAVEATDAESEGDSDGRPGGARPADGPPDPGLDERTTVRITDDVDQFFGIDEREYDLDPEDVVTLPAENAEPLLQRGAAERVE